MIIFQDAMKISSRCIIFYNGDDEFNITHRRDRHIFSWMRWCALAGHGT